MPLHQPPIEPMILPVVEHFGHSYSTGGGATSPTQFRWTRRFASMLGAEDMLYALAGSKASWPDLVNNTSGAHLGGWPTVLQTLIRDRSGAAGQNRGIGHFDTAESSCITVYTGVNDLGAWSGVGQLGVYQHAMRTIIARCVSSAVMESTDASVVRGGVWTAAPSLLTRSSGQGGVASYYTTTASAATVTISVPSDFPGGNVFLGFTADPTSGANTVTIKVDGGTVATNYQVSGAAVCDTYGSPAIGTRWNGIVYRCANLTPGAHTILITTTIVSGTIAFDYWSVEALHPPIVLVGDQPRQFIASGNLTDANVLALNVALKSVVDEFGPTVQMTNVDGVFNKQADYYYADNLHPNDYGHAAIAAEFYRVAWVIWQSITPMHRALLAVPRRSYEVPATIYESRGPMRASITMHSPAVANGTSWVVPTLALRAEFLGACSMYLNLEGYNEMRLVAAVVTAAAPAAAALSIEAAPIFGQQEIGVGTDVGIRVLVGTGHTGLQTSVWTGIPPNLKRGDIAFRVSGLNGDGTTAGKFGLIAIQLR